jgi:hypothetical protein
MREHEIDIGAIRKIHTTSEQRQTTRIQTDWRYPQQLSKPTNLLTYDPIHHIFGPLNRIIEPKSEVKRTSRCLCCGTLPPVIIQNPFEINLTIVGVYDSFIQVTRL